MYEIYLYDMNHNPLGHWEGVDDWGRHNDPWVHPRCAPSIYGNVKEWKRLNSAELALERVMSRYAGVVGTAELIEVSTRSVLRRVSSEVCTATAV